MKFRRRRDQSLKEFQNIEHLFSITSTSKFRNQLKKAKDEMPELYNTYNMLYLLVMQFIEDSFDDGTKN